VATTTTRPSAHWSGGAVDKAAVAADRPFVIQLNSFIGLVLRGYSVNRHVSRRSRVACVALILGSRILLRHSKHCFNSSRADSMRARAVAGRSVNVSALNSVQPRVWAACRRRASARRWPPSAMLQAYPQSGSLAARSLGKLELVGGFRPSSSAIRRSSKACWGSPHRRWSWALSSRRSMWKMP